ncbi:MAG TPA: Nramp family divalent metal transporter [Candidatus Dojkabacteria bacterium]|nr:Nramp family divalent metal transporter [Candidatus Dojkabacteria bacterium]
MVKKFPKFNRVTIKDLGASLVTLGMGLGSGEFILWPMLTVSYGYGILWGALVGISMQLVLISELQRYTSVSGEDIVTGSRRIHPLLPLVLLIASVLGFGWPGFTSSASTLLIDAYPSITIDPTILAILFLIVCALILVVGKNAYAKLEPLQTAIVVFSFLIIIYLASKFFDFEAVLSFTQGFLTNDGRGLSLPDNISFATYLGAIAYAGTGGILILSQSFYSIEEQHGMTQYVPHFSLKKKSSDVDIVASEDSESVSHFRKLRGFQVGENVIFFWLLGIITIFALSFLARQLLSGYDILPGSLDFLKLEAFEIGSQFGDSFSKAFLLIGVFALLSVQIGVYDITARVAVMVLRSIVGIAAGRLYTIAVIVQLLMGIVIFMFISSEPVWLLVTGAVINALCMSLISLVAFILNRKYIPGGYRPNSIVSSLLLLFSAIYLILFIINIFV